MTQRITKAMLDKQIECLNTITGNALTQYKRDPDGSYPRDSEGRLFANAGNYHLEGAYGGWKLCQMIEGGGSRNVLYMGYESKPRCHELIDAYINGITDATQR